MLHDVVNPARFSEVVGQVRMFSEADVDAVLKQAANAFKTWARTTPEHRASRLQSAALDLRVLELQLVPLLVRENGKTLREAETDIRRSIELMEIIAADLVEWSKPAVVDSKQPVFARKRARGVTAVISPWNSPVLLSFKRMIPAIATGNSVVLKPATNCPLSITECVNIMNANFPPGVLNVVTGTGQVVGEKLATDERVRAIAFTGSTETGRRIMELSSRTVKKLYLELGGNDPAIVLHDAMLDHVTVARMTHAILRAAGQVCIAIKRIYVHNSRYDELVEKLGAAFDNVVVGDGMKGDTMMGPLNNKAQFEFVGGLLERSRKEKLTVLTKGSQLEPEHWQEGYFMLPSIILGANEDHEIVRSEQFGPVVPIIPFADEEDAIAKANRTPYGLRASVWTSNREHAAALADRIEAGAVFWNNHGIFQDLHIEFPGVKQSGLSRESRSAALDHYTDTYGFAE